MQRKLWPNLAEIPRFSQELDAKNFPSGQRRMLKDPSPERVLQAFEELGTHNAVAAAFGVTRPTVTKWIRRYALDIVSRPEVRHENFIRKCLVRQEDKIRVAQWVVDECSVGTAYFRRQDLTSLLVGGSMNDFEAINAISNILQSKICSSKSPNDRTLPLFETRVVSAKAYTLLEVILPHMFGLKALEAKAALSFFPKTGIMRGRHTTDEFLTPIWKEFARKSVILWNQKRRIKFSECGLKDLADSWVEGRIRRARRFLDTRIRSAPRPP